MSSTVTIAMTVRRAGVAALAMVAALLANPLSSQAQAERGVEAPPLTVVHLLLIKAALKLETSQLVLWEPLEAELRIAIAARQKARGDAFAPFFASLAHSQKERAGVLLRPLIDTPWPKPVYRVVTANDPTRSTFRLLMRDGTLHGVEQTSDRWGRPVVNEAVPIGYYHRQSPIARAIAVRQQILGADKGRYGVVGLGAGAVACYKQEGETWRFFESEAAVVKIAWESFTFVSQCQPDIDIAIGNPRLKLASEPEASFDLIYVDPYFLDGSHLDLLTKEALELILSKLKPEGVAVVHVTSRLLDLTAVLGATLKLLPAGTAGMAVDDLPTDFGYAALGTRNVVLAKSETILAPYRTALKGVTELNGKDLRPWTDGYSDIWSAWHGK